MLKKKFTLSLSIVAMALSLGSCAKKIETGSLQVIPQVQELNLSQDESPFVIKTSVKVVYPEGNELMKNNAEFLVSYIKDVTGIQLKTKSSATREIEKGQINLVLDESLGKEEGYLLHSSTDQISIKSATEKGIFYGVQTLHKALPILKDHSALPAIPAGEVNDYPRFDYRGFMVDVGRHYFSLDYLKELIDVMAMHNINYFHWHLTEDQGWRIEIKKYPNLTQVGSTRKSTLIDWETKEQDGVPHSGFYTQEEAKELVAYAAKRYITVIPEIDLPGHMLAALASYPELGCTGGPYEVATQWGVFTDVLCGGNDNTLQFAKDVLNEIMDIFPSPYIHIGGDECPKARWKECPKCQAKIKELGIKQTPEHSKENQLQTYFMSEVAKEIHSRGRRMLGWDEILHGGLKGNPIVLSWTSVKGGIEAARQHHNVIMTPIQHLYFSNPGYNKLQGVNSIARVYNFEPIPAVLTPEEQKYIIGAQGCIWTEWTKDRNKMEWQMMPRIAALSEIQWTQSEHKNLDNFLERLPHMLDLYTLHGLTYKDDIYAVNINVKDKDEDTQLVELVTFDKSTVFYTTDGEDPTSQSLQYTAPFEVKKGQTVKAIAIREESKNNSTIAEKEI